MAFEPDDLETAASANVLTDESLVVNPLTLINGRGLRRVRVQTNHWHYAIACSLCI